jgi:hypothetical protein
MTRTTKYGLEMFFGLTFGSFTVALILTAITGNNTWMGLMLLGIALGVVAIFTHPFGQDDELPKCNCCGQEICDGNR